MKVCLGHRPTRPGSVQLQPGRGAAATDVRLFETLHPRRVALCSSGLESRARRPCRDQCHRRDGSWAVRGACGGAGWPALKVASWRTWPAPTARPSLAAQELRPRLEPEGSAQCGPALRAEYLTTARTATKGSSVVLTTLHNRHVVHDSGRPRGRMPTQKAPVRVSALHRPAAPDRAGAHNIHAHVAFLAPGRAQSS